jgi:hypothetical protein
MSGWIITVRDPGFGVDTRPMTDIYFVRISDQTEALKAVDNRRKALDPVATVVCEMPLKALQALGLHEDGQILEYHYVG